MVALGCLVGLVVAGCSGTDLLNTSSLPSLPTLPTITGYSSNHSE